MLKKRKWCLLVFKGDKDDGGWVEMPNTDDDLDIFLYFMHFDINLWKTTHTLFNVSNVFVHCFLLIRQSGFLLFISVTLSVTLLLYCDANHAILSLPVMFGCTKACMPQLMFYVLLWTLLCSHMTTLLIIKHVVIILCARQHKACALKYYYHKASTSMI